MTALSVPFCAQEADGYCFPACVQMSLAFQDISYSQRRLASKLGLIQGFGVPASNIHNIRSRSIQTEYQTEGTLSDIQRWLGRNVPVICSVQTGQLEYWQRKESQHAVLIVGLDDDVVQLFDPAKNSYIIRISVDEFLLAWDEMGFTYAVVHKVS